MALSTRMIWAWSKRIVGVSLLIVLLVVGYWFFFTSKWIPAIPKDSHWQYGFLEDTVETVTLNVKWLRKESGKLTKEEREEGVLVLNNSFHVADTSKVLQAVLLLKNSYSVKVLLNGKELVNVDRFHIGREVFRPAPNGVGFTASWRRRKVFLPQEMFSNALKVGENAITLIVSDKYGVSDFKLSNMELRLQVKGPIFRSIVSPLAKLNEHVFNESKLPIFKIDAHNMVIPDEPKIQALLTIFDNDGDNKLSNPGVTQEVRIERRGYTSQKAAKRSYTMAIAEEQELLGLPASKRWVLYGPYMDKSLIRNALVYDLFRQMGRHAPKFRFMELVLNNNYRGIYMLVEKIQIGEQHLDIAELRKDQTDSTRYTGGYLLEIDRAGTRASFPLETDADQEHFYYQLHSPKWARKDQNAMKLIDHRFYSLEEHIYEKNGPLYMIDMDSFIDYMIITEFSKNVDGYRLSLFIFDPQIESDTPKFHIGPLWDQNFTFGLTSFKTGFNPEGYMYNYDNTIPFWWNHLINDDTFYQRLSERYVELRSSVLSEINVNMTIDSLVGLVGKAQVNNFKKWEVFGAGDFWPNYFIGDNYLEEIDYLKSWIRMRSAFLDLTLFNKGEFDSSTTHGEAKKSKWSQIQNE